MNGREGKDGKKKRDEKEGEKRNRKTWYRKKMKCESTSCVLFFFSHPHNFSPFTLLTFSHSQFLTFSQVFFPHRFSLFCSFRDHLNSGKNCVIIIFSTYFCIQILSHHNDADALFLLCLPPVSLFSLSLPPVSLLSPSSLLFEEQQILLLILS